MFDIDLYYMHLTVGDNSILLYISMPIACISQIKFGLFAVSIYLCNERRNYPISNTK